GQSVRAAGRRLDRVLRVRITAEAGLGQGLLHEQRHASPGDFEVLLITGKAKEKEMTESYPGRADNEVVPFRPEIGRRHRHSGEFAGRGDAEFTGLLDKEVGAGPAGVQPRRKVNPA